MQKLSKESHAKLKYEILRSVQGLHGWAASSHELLTSASMLAMPGRFQSRTTLAVNQQCILVVWAGITHSSASTTSPQPHAACSSSGSLCRKYIVQDHKYLDVFSRMLNSLAAKAPGAHEATVFTKSALSVYEVETGLHQKLLKEWEVSMDQVEEAEMQPACLLYTSYLSNVVQSKPFHEGATRVPSLL